MSGGMNKLCENIMTDVCEGKKWTLSLISTHTRETEAL